jgi:hypothetical protein
MSVKELYLLYKNSYLNGWCKLFCSVCCGVLVLRLVAHSFSPVRYAHFQKLGKGKRLLVFDRSPFFSCGLDERSEETHFAR